MILGAGMVVKPMVHHLLDNRIDVTLASRTREIAIKVGQRSVSYMIRSI